MPRVTAMTIHLARAEPAMRLLGINLDPLGIERAVGAGDRGNVALRDPREPPLQEPHGGPPPAQRVQVSLLINIPDRPLLTTAQRMHVDGKLLDRLRIEASGPRGHHPVAAH